MNGTFVNSTEDFYRNVKDPGMTDEVTLSHMLRGKNSFLRSPYGSVIADFLLGKGVLKDGSEVLEIGPGTGEFAEAFVGRSRVKSYDFLDISKRLLGFLRKRFKGGRFGFIEGDATRLSGGGKRYNTVICNEVLADLPAVVNLDPENPPEEGVIAESLGMIKKYKLRTPGHPFNFNYGAVRFLEGVTRVLEKGGTVLIIENMSDPGYPMSIPVFGHREFNVRFSWLERVSRDLGLSAERGKMTELLGVKGKRFLSMFLVPELKVIFDQMNRQGRSKGMIEKGTLAMTPEELAGFLESCSSFIGIGNTEEYLKQLSRKARDITYVTDQFGYLLLRKG